MSKYHNKRYQQVKRQMLYFLVFELIPNLVGLIKLILMILLKKQMITLETYIKFAYFYEVINTFYPLLQTIGMVFLKDSSDPL